MLGATSWGSTSGRAAVLLPRWRQDGSARCEGKSRCQGLGQAELGVQIQVCALWGSCLQLGKRNLCCGGVRYRTHAQAAALSLEKAKHILQFEFLRMMHSSYNFWGGWEFSISAKTGLIQTGGTSAGSDAQGSSKHCAIYYPRAWINWQMRASCTRKPPTFFPKGQAMRSIHSRAELLDSPYTCSCSAFWNRCAQ